MTIIQLGIDYLVGMQILAPWNAKMHSLVACANTASWFDAKFCFDLSC